MKCVMAVTRGQSFWAGPSNLNLANQGGACGRTATRRVLKGWAAFSRRMASNMPFEGRNSVFWEHKALLLSLLLRAGVPTRKTWSNPELAVLAKNLLRPGYERSESQSSGHELVNGGEDWYGHRPSRRRSMCVSACSVPPGGARRAWSATAAGVESITADRFTHPGDQTDQNGSAA